MRIQTAALVVMLAASCGGRPPAPTARPVSAPIALSLRALDGGTIELAALRGKIVVVHAFTTWSLAAQSDIDQLRAADAQPDVVVLGVALDPEGRLIAAPWQHANHIPYLVGLADSQLTTGQSPLGRLSIVPTTIVLDRTGRIYDRAERPLEPDELDRVLTAVRSLP